MASTWIRVGSFGSGGAIAAFGGVGSKRDVVHDRRVRRGPRCPALSRSHRRIFQSPGAGTLTFVASSLPDLRASLPVTHLDESAAPAGQNWYTAAAMGAAD